MRDFKRRGISSEVLPVFTQDPPSAAHDRAETVVIFSGQSGRPIRDFQAAGSWILTPAEGRERAGAVLGRWRVLRATPGRAPGHMASAEASQAER